LECHQGLKCWNGNDKRNEKLKGPATEVSIAKNEIKGLDDQTKPFVIVLKRILFKLMTE